MAIKYPVPPCGMQQAGGAQNRQLPEYPNGPMIWPDLHEDLPVQLALDSNADSNRLEGLKISSTNGEEIGILVTAEEKVVIDQAEITMTGDGRNDFNCVGCGVVADRGCELVLQDCTIETTGLAKCATSATEGACLKVYDSTLIAHGGKLPEDYDPTPGPGGMLTPPPGLEIGGTARAHLSMKHSLSYFYRSKIVADGWAALSTDASDGFVYLEANDCDIEVKTPGYGVYSDGGCNVVLSNCRVKTATHTGILAGECTAVFDQVNADSGKYFLMVHNVMGVTGELAEATIIGGDIKTGEESLYLKSCNSYIELQGSKIESKSGVIAHAIVNPDMCATKTEGKEVFGNNIVLSDMKVSGDFINDDSDRVMTLTLDGTSLEGALKDVHLSLNASSKWLATADSDVAIMEGADYIDAKEGITVNAYGNSHLQGNEVKTASGGRIVYR